ncbi:MAG: hypothetical protein U1A27_13495 [Phycisphaerae bacterium]
MTIRRILCCRRAGLLAGGFLAAGLGGCEQIFQQNVEAFYAPQVLQNAFLLPFTFLFRLFGRLL